MSAAPEAPPELLERVARGLLDASPLLVALADTGGRFLYHNGEVQNVLGWRPEQVVGRPVLDFIHAPDRARTATTLARVLEGETVRGEEVRALHVDGSPRWLTYAAVPDLDQGVVRFIGQDTHDLVATRHRLTRSQQLLRQAMRMARLGAWEIDGATSRVRWSEETYRIHEVDPAWQPTREGALAFFPKETRDEVARRLERCLQEGEPFAYEGPLRTAEGRSIWIQAFGEPIRESDGTIAGVRGVVQDISVRRESDALKDRFLAMVSHELRTPLTALYGALRLLQAKHAEALGTRGQQLLDAGARNAEQLRRLVDDLLDVSRLASDRPHVEPGEGDLDAVVREGVESLRTTAAERGVQLRQVEPGPVRGRFDPGRLVQVLVNLLSNAIRFSPEGEVIEVQALRIGARLRVEVRDRGPGVSPEDTEVAFERFRQLHRDASRGGFGLGLAISKSIVVAHGGVIGLAPRVGGGTVAWFELPADA
ncbi:MAG TPA: PAS domain S-box protein [Polyangiaceae bacterium LLY-WYZ-15_(1-7)]|nr:hypothetical protein [Myxococcales bacterium]MAT29470.1 hypothetical protein [Sandaracinus sp.]HJL05082.1 PAS domain S-box protein [Polyangiaceae bacterium LLY-WYZ-15_(1-7)]MBJ70652.1 hypothetical protein [Sandaracinus sp.]HJL10581.1 PAS domain S-box protein [Polyangiaceae bacterium LLY-WYZ-15_(1-7)]